MATQDRPVFTLSANYFFHQCKALPHYFFSTLIPINITTVPGLHAHSSQILQSYRNSFEITIAANTSAFNSVVTS